MNLIHGPSLVQHKIQYLKWKRFWQKTGKVRECKWVKKTLDGISSIKYKSKSLFCSHSKYFLKSKIPTVMLRLCTVMLLDHIIWTIPCGPYYVDHIMWTILCGPYHVDQLMWSILSVVENSDGYSLDHIIWTISPYHMDHFMWIISFILYHMVHIWYGPYHFCYYESHLRSQWPNDCKVTVK